MKKLLFVCGQNRLRSPTAEEVFSKYDNVEAIGCGTNKDSATTLSGDLIEWADIIFVMEKSHREKVAKKHRELLKDKRLICLEIRDIYKRMDPELIRVLEAKVRRAVRL